MSSRVFVSYRREDSAGDAGRLADHLAQRFGAESVFLDVETILAGTDFVRGLNESLQQTSVLLVIIGPRWLSLRDAQGNRRLDDPADFVRLEIERALARDIPLIPVLVQGAAFPAAADLPASLALLARRQALTLDHAEFHDDARRLCERIASLVETSAVAPPRRRHVRVAAAAVAAVLLAIVAAVFLMRDRDTTAVVTTPEDGAAKPATVTREVEELLTTAAAQRRRNESVEALDTLARARTLAPDSTVVRQLQEDVAMEWIRDVRFEAGKSTFSEAIKPATAIVDVALTSATGQRRADLLAHSGWAAFMFYRDGDHRLNPGDWYREAIEIDPQNPYANAMLAHWRLFQKDDVPNAARLFRAALASGRAVEDVRALQWSGYANADTPDADVELVRVADAMRQREERLNVRQASTLYNPYYRALTGRDRLRELLLEALPPDDHIKTLDWALGEFNEGDGARSRIVAFYVALLNAKAGRMEQAVDTLTRMEAELKESPGSLQDAVSASLAALRGDSPARGGRGGERRGRL